MTDRAGIEAALRAVPLLSITILSHDVYGIPVSANQAAVQQVPDYAAMAALVEGELEAQRKDWMLYVGQPGDPTYEDLSAECKRSATWCDELRVARDMADGRYQRANALYGVATQEIARLRAALTSE